MALPSASSSYYISDRLLGPATGCIKHHKTIGSHQPWRIGTFCMLSPSSMTTAEASIRKSGPELSPLVSSPGGKIGMGRKVWGIGYGSIPINIFRGMNIHLPAILMFTRGTRFWHTANWERVETRKTDEPRTTDFSGYERGGKHDFFREECQHVLDSDINQQRRGDQREIYRGEEIVVSVDQTKGHSAFQTQRVWWTLLRTDCRSLHIMAGQRPWCFSNSNRL